MLSVMRGLVLSLGTLAWIAIYPAFAVEAPDFSLTTIDNKTVALSSLKGKVVFLDFWATWCPPCRKSIPAVEALHKKYKGAQVVVLGINVEGNASAAKRFAQKNNLSYPVLIGDNKTAAKYGVSGIPAFFIIAPDGAIKERFVGYQSGMEDEWTRAINGLIKNGK